MSASTKTESRLKPAPAIAGISHYQVPRPKAPVDLYLDGNEGVLPPRSLFNLLVEKGPQVVRNYPSPKALESQIAESWGVLPEQVVLTCGADSALDAAARAVLAPGREAILPFPTFEMIERYCRFTGCTIVEVQRPDGSFPVKEVVAARSDKTAAVFIVSPNNPTGSVISEEELRSISAAFPDSMLIVDLAYVEFADIDLTRAALALGNAIVIRTLSKAWGMAGLRVGYAVGPLNLIKWVHAAANPYGVSGPALVMAAEWLKQGRPAMSEFVAKVCREREQLNTLLTNLGCSISPSQSIFSFARTDRASWIHAALGSLGIAVRAFPGRRGLEDALRITCPGDDALFKRLCAALEIACRPQAVIFDMDGVLADVSTSYREAILQTAASFGVELTKEDISQEKARGNANNDWVVTQRALARRGVEAPLEEVTSRFENAYQGTADLPGLWQNESLLLSREALLNLKQRFRLAVVTGRPRGDAERFLKHHNVADLFETMVCMEDGPLKPDPAPVLRVLERLDVQRALLVGDTPDDITAARRAQVIPIGVLPPGEKSAGLPEALYAAGASVVCTDTEQLLEVLK